MTDSDKKSVFQAADFHYFYNVTTNGIATFRRASR
jgi:hypothetical protein